MSKISFAIKNPSFAAEGKSAKAVRTPGCPKAGEPCPGQRKIKKRLAIAGFTTSKRRHQQARFPRGNVHNAECQSFFLISSQSPSFLLDGIIIQDEGEVVKGKKHCLRKRAGGGGRRCLFTAEYGSSEVFLYFPGILPGSAQEPRFAESPGCFS